MAEPAASPRLDRIWPFVGLLAFVGAIALLHHELAGYSYRGVMRSLSAVPRARLGGAIGLTVLAYGVLPGYDLMALRYAGRALPFRRIAFGSFIAYAFSQTLGVPLLTGGSIRYRLWSSWGLSSAEIARAVGFVAFSFGFGIVLLSGVAFLVEPASTASLLGLSTSYLRTVGVLELTLAAGYIGWALFRKTPVEIRGWSLPTPGRLIVGGQVLVPILDWVLAATVLFVLLPPGHGLAFGAFLGVFLMAQFAGILSHVPGGLGVFETLMLLMLKPQFGGSGLLGVLIAYRAVYYLIPFCAAVAAVGFQAARPHVPAAWGVARTVGDWIPQLVPQVLSGAVFLTGAVLLISGATPAVPGRLNWLGQLLPLGLIELSHFLGSVAGAGLLVLAWALWHRLDAAYGLAVALLAVGIGASLLKGADWEEATILAVVLGAVLPARRYFYRKSAIGSAPLDLGWIIAMLMVLGGMVWLGLFAHKHTEYSNELWWRFALRADAPRFLRATVGVAAVLLIVALLRMFRHAPIELALPGPAELERAIAVIAASPVAAANLALLGDKSLLFSDSGAGLLMYGIEGRSWVAFGDPLGPPADQVELAWRLREIADRHGGWTAFYQVGVNHLPLYIDLGLTLLKLGEEARVPLGEFSLDGPERRGLRRNQRQVERLGVSFDVIPAVDVGPLLPELRAISDAWLVRKRTREKGFSMGRFEDAYMTRFPLAVARQGGAIVAFANVWPTAMKTELSVDLMRHAPDAPDGVMQYLFTELMLWGRAQQYQSFLLGMAPFSGLERRMLAPLWSKLGTIMYQHGEQFYNFQGLREFKQKFNPVWEPRYLASPGGLAFPRILTNIASLISGGLRGVVGK